MPHRSRVTGITAAPAPRAQTAAMTRERYTWTALQCRVHRRSCRVLWRWRQQTARR